MNESEPALLTHHNVVYVVTEVLVAVMAVFGNLLVLVAFSLDRRLRKLTNYYIASLAVADCLVGLLGVPFAVLTQLGLPEHQFHACLFMLSVLVILCTISILNLVAVSVDRFWAILFPLVYKRLMTKKAAKGIIVVCWIMGTLIGLLPVMGWHGTAHRRCLFVIVMNYNYLVFLYFSTIIFPSVLMGAFYLRIYCVVVKQGRDTLKVKFPASSEHEILRTVERKKDVNAAKNLFIIVIFFVLCWIPLYTINCVQAFCADCAVPQQLTDFTIILSHVNSAGNPIIYACHLRDFRRAMRMCLTGKHPSSGHRHHHRHHHNHYATQNTDKIQLQQALVNSKLQCQSSPSHVSLVSSS